MLTDSRATTTRRRRWAAVAVVLTLTTTACEDNRPADAVIGSPVAAAATERAVQALVADSGFIGEVTQAGDGSRPVCAARPMGISPDVASADEVETVYAWIDCKWIPADGDTTTTAPDPAALPGLTSPIIVFLGDDLLYDLPLDGEEREQSITGAYPANLRKAALGGNPEQAAVTRELDALVARELG